jgi:hypothetical protein
VNAPDTTMTYRILILLSEWGDWGEELVAPLTVFDAKNCSVDFVTAKGQRPIALPASYDSKSIDPPLGRMVASPDMAGAVKKIDDPKTPEGCRLNNPIDPSSWLPKNPLLSSSNYIREREEYFRRAQTLLDAGARIDLVAYDGKLPVEIAAEQLGAEAPIVAELRQRASAQKACESKSALEISSKVSNLFAQRVS